MTLKCNILHEVREMRERLEKIETDQKKLQQHQKEMDDRLEVIRKDLKKERKDIRVLQKDNKEIREYIGMLREVSSKTRTHTQRGYDLFIDWLLDQYDPPACGKTPQFPQRASKL